MSNYTIGIDCGLDGGFAIIDNNTGQLVKRFITPTQNLGKGRRIDTHEIDTIFKLIAEKIKAGDNWQAIVEDPGKHAPGAAGLWSMTFCFATIEALLISHRIRHHIVGSQKWQKSFWTKPKMPKGVKFDTKAAALIAARKLWPAETWRAASEKTGKLLKNPHDGLVDAALLAEYCRREF